MPETRRAGNIHERRASEFQSKQHAIQLHRVPVRWFTREIREWEEEDVENAADRDEANDNLPTHSAKQILQIEEDVSQLQKLKQCAWVRMQEL